MRDTIYFANRQMEINFRIFHEIHQVGEKFPESFDTAVQEDLAYTGHLDLTDHNSLTPRRSQPHTFSV